MRCSLTLAVVTLVASTYLAADASAETILLYKGDKYDSVYIHPLYPLASDNDLYTTSMRVTGRVVLESPLPPGAISHFWSDYGDHGDGLIDFRMSDGVTDGHHGWRHAGFNFQTDASGKIVAWSIGMDTASEDGYLESSNHSGDYATLVCYNCLGTVDPYQWAQSDSPGRWKVKTVPESGSSLLLLSIGIAALGLVHRRQLRAKNL